MLQVFTGKGGGERGVRGISNFKDDDLARGLEALADGRVMHVMLVWILGGHVFN